MRVVLCKEDAAAGANQDRLFIWGVRNGEQVSRRGSCFCLEPSSLPTQWSQRSSRIMWLRVRVLDSSQITGTAICFDVSR
jgi:hypothetical protein